MKKFTLTLTIFAIVLGMLFAIGCGGEQITLNKTEITLKAYTTEQLVASAEDVTWSSSDESVAVVSDSGLVTALKVGTATIKAEKDGKVGTCAVTVEENEDAPILEVGEKEITLLEGATHILDVVLTKSEEIISANISYSSSNTEVAEVTDYGVITAKTFGQSTITVTAQAQGYTIIEQIALTVREDIDVVCDIDSLELVIVAPDSRFITQKALNVEVYIKGVKDENAYASLTIESTATNVAVYEANTKLIKAVGVGEAVIKVSYTSLRNTITTVEIPVYVDKAHINDGERLTLDYGTSQSNIVVDFESVVSGLNYDSIQNICKVKNGKKEEISYTKSGTNGISFAKEDFEIGSDLYYVQTQNYVYVIDICVADKVINSADELIAFLQEIKDEAPSNFIMLDKYIALGGDIDLSGKTVPGIGWENVFAGTFDGRGYTISNAKLGIGLFNYVKGTVKNISLVDAEASYPNGRNGFICAIADDGSLIENIYVKGKKFFYSEESDAQNGGVIFGGSGTVRNVIAYIEYTESNMQTLADVTGIEHGAFTRALADRAVVANVYIVSQTAQNLVATGNGTVANSALYASESEMLSGADFSAFDGMWRRNASGVPVLKGYYDFVENVPNATKLSGEIYFDRSTGSSVKLNLASLEINESEVSKIVKMTSSNAAELQFNNNGGIYLAKDALVRGENVLYVYVGDDVYEIKVLSVDKIISTVSEFEAFLTEIKNGDEKVGEYIILSSDITYASGSTVTTTVYDYSFKGTLDGRGHVIYNAVISDSRAIFSTVAGTIKNLGMVGAQNSRYGAENAVLVYELQSGAVIDNCYVEAKICYAEGNTGGLVYYFAGSATVSNCVVDISYYWNGSCTNPVVGAPTSGTCGAISCGDYDGAVTSNCFVITPNQLSVHGTVKGMVTNCASGVNEDAILTSGTYDFSSFNSEYWILESGKLPVFKSYYDKVLSIPEPTQTSGETYFDKSSGANVKLDLSIFGIEESEITKIEDMTDLTATEIAFTNNNGIYIAKDALSSGEKILYVYAGSNIYAVKVVSADQVISSVSEFEAFLTEVKNGDGKEGKYIVLSSDITYASGSTVTTTVYDYPFKGTLDGRGHVIYDAVISDNRAIFSTFTGTIKNLGIVGARNARYGNENAILVYEMRAGARIENCYVDAKICWAEGNTGGLVYYFAGESTITIENCIVNISYYWNGSCTTPVEGKPYTGVIGLLGVTDETFVVTSNCFGTTPNELGLYGIEKGGAITNSAYGANEQAILAGGTYDFSSFNSEYWTLESGKLPVFKGVE